MSTVSNKFKEYIWLVNTIRKAHGITFSEIQEKWLDTEMSYGVELARSTFNRHKDAIEDIFGIYIECDVKRGYKYYIGNESVLQNDSVQNWMLSTLSVNQIVSENLSVQKRIMLEPVPCEDYLEQVIEAMKRNVRVKVLYRRYGTAQSKTLCFEPYCIKLFKQRWYVLGHFHRDATPEKEELDYFGMFSFDRISEMILTDEHFEIDKDFDAKEFFKDCWGVVANDDTEPQRIVIRAFDNERYYLRDLPLHHSQKAIAEGEDYIDYELWMRPTYDFSGHILSRGSQLQVLEPQWLVDEIYEMLMDAVGRYE